MVAKPRRSEDFLCQNCQQPGPWASPEQAAGWQKEQEQRRAREAAQRGAQQTYAALIKQIGDGDTSAELAKALREAMPATGYSGAELLTNHLQTVRSYFDRALDDNSLSEDEDERLLAIVSALGLTWEQVLSSDAAIRDRLMVARANAGRLPSVKSPRLMAKPGEVVHAEYEAQLMKEVTIREWVSGYRGFSVPLGRTGIRYRFGSSRGHSVVVGTEVQVADQGILAITQQRTVFTGARKTLEFQHKKLAGLDVFRDGVQLHVTNRQTPSLFKVWNGEVVAAVVTAAQREGTPE